jgi:hypothetical protein
MSEAGQKLRFDRLAIISGLHRKPVSSHVCRVVSNVPAPQQMAALGLVILSLLA